MSSLLSAEQIVDLVRSYDNLSPLTNITVFLGGSGWIGGPYKNIGPNHIDIGDSTYTARFSLDEQFIRINVGPGDKIELHLPSTTLHIR